MGFLFPEERQQRNWLAWMFFQKGTALLYSGQEWGAAHRPGLFDADPVDRNGNAKHATLIQRLCSLKKNELFYDGVFTMKAYPNDLLAAEWIKNGKRILGLFSLKGQSGLVPVSIQDGFYQNLLTDTLVLVESGFMVCNGEPIIFLLNE